MDLEIHYLQLGIVKLLVAGVFVLVDLTVADRLLSASSSLKMVRPQMDREMEGAVRHRSIGRR
jgi:hypothetical protein